MPIFPNGNRQVAGSRRGVSFVEFVGCLAALGGGVAIGSLYLGVDVKAMAVGILEKADIEVPALLNAKKPVSVDSSDKETPAKEVVLAEEALNEETATLTPDDEKASEDSAWKELTDDQKWAATQDCWLALKQSIREESSNRSKSINHAESWQLFDYLLHRKAGHQKVVETIEQLDHQGVDPRLHAHVEQVLAWHRTGMELYDRAGQLLTDAPSGQLTGPFAQSWQSAATQHRMEEKLILNKHAAIANYLEHSQKRTSAYSPSNSE